MTSPAPSLKENCSVKINNGSERLRGHSSYRFALSIGVKDLAVLQFSDIANRHSVAGLRCGTLSNYVVRNLYATRKGLRLTELRLGLLTLLFLLFLLLLFFLLYTVHLSSWNSFAALSLQLLELLLLFLG